MLPVDKEREKDKTCAIKVWYIDADGLYIFQMQNSWHCTVLPRLNKLIHCTVKKLTIYHCEQHAVLYILIKSNLSCYVQHIWPVHIHSRFDFWLGPGQNLAFPSAAIYQINLLHGNGPAITNTMWWWPSNIPAILWQPTSYHQEVGIASLAFTWQPVTFRLTDIFPHAPIPDSYWVKETGRLTHSHTYNINLTH